ncbi:hypothetical protein DL95DRAFT_501699 [Leptodontidium sp. 2 PMI_412]|nr:hypothetical protein DL95DRAFT_501699 [Leptodontidium sp. 2 PMI_412]
MNHQTPCLVYPPGHPLHVAAPADVATRSEDINGQENTEEMREAAHNTIVFYDSSCEHLHEDSDEESNPNENVQRTEAALNSTVTHTESPEPVDTSVLPSSIVTSTEVVEDSEAEEEGDDCGVLVTARELLESSDDQMSSASSATLMEPESRPRSRSASSDDLYYASPGRRPAMSPALSTTSTFAGLESESESKSESSSGSQYDASPQMGPRNSPVQSIDDILQLQLPEGTIPEGWPSDVPFSSTIAMLMPLPIEVLRSLLTRRGHSYGASSSNSSIVNPDNSQVAQSSGVNLGHSRPAPVTVPGPAVREPNYTARFETSEWWMMHAELSSRYASLGNEIDHNTHSNGNGIAETEDEDEDELEPEGGTELDSGEEADVDSEFEDELEFEREEDVREGGPDVESGAEADGESEAESETCVGSESGEWGYDVGGSDRATRGSSGSEDNTCVESEDADEEDGGVPVWHEDGMAGLGW